MHFGYVEQVTRAGGVPVVLPFGDADDYADLPAWLDGLLLTGGEDIDPRYARGTTHQAGYDYDPDRDAFEIALVTSALAADLPVLGICRGCQVLHVATGNGLLGEVNDGAVRHRTSLLRPSTHRVALSQGSLVHKAYRRDSILVTSYHHQGLAFDQRADRTWRSTATSDDALVEGIEHRGGSWAVGVLWHPELPADAAARGPDPLIAAFVAATGES